MLVMFFTSRYAILIYCAALAVSGKSNTKSESEELGKTEYDLKNKAVGFSLTSISIRALACIFRGDHFLIWLAI
jgi:hypothetical protein